MLSRKLLPVFMVTSLLTFYSYSEEQLPWYERLLVGMEVGPTGAQFGGDTSDIEYAAKFSGKDIVAAQLQTGSQYIVIWGKDSEYAYYNSNAAPQCPGLNGRDVIQETIDAAKPHNLPVIIYCVVQGNGYPLRDHPEYEMRGADGARLGRICFNSGYIDHAKAVLDEMLQYDISGLHIDMLDQGFGPPYGCWCERCQSLFKKEYGEEMPAGVTWDEDWDKMLEFRYNTSDRFEKELYQYVKSIKPGITVDFNYHGYPPFSFEVGQRPVQHSDNGDFVTGETGVWGFSALGVGQTARFLAASTPGRRYQVVMQRGVRMYHDQTTRPLNDMRWEMFTLLAHGGQVTIVDKTRYDGSLDSVAYDRFGKIFKEVLKKKDHFGQPNYAEVGIYYSQRTRDWYAKEEAWRYQQSFNGAHATCVYEHIPYEIVLDENVSLNSITHLKTLILPNIAILSDREINLFKTYLENGGNLIVTGVTGMYDWMGRPRNDSAISELSGANAFEILPSLDNHVQLHKLNQPRMALYEQIPLDWPFLVEGPGVVYKATTAEAIGDLMKPARTVRQKQGKESTDMPMSPDQSVGPAILLNQYGRGKIVTIAGSPDYASASEHRMTEDRYLLRNAIRYLNQEPEISIDAPTIVETVISREENRFRVHFLGRQTPPGWTPSKNRPYSLPTLVEDEPLYRASVKIRNKIKDAFCSNDNTVLNKVSDHQIDLLINDVHDVVIIDL
ncbi:MAG: hypothetical protein GC154_01795 [bacterium]|nr:hypothetical protein [bacterium]